jgi:hypothetical protein
MARLENESMQKYKKIVVASSIVLGLLGAFAAYKLAMDTFGVPGELHQYYPVSTGFYLELAPGDKLTQRFIAYLDEQAAHEAKDETKDEATDEAAKPATPPIQPTLPIGSEDTNASNSPATTTTTPTVTSADNKRTRFRRLFLQKFNSTFYSYFSLGIWPNKLTSQNTGPDEGNVLVVFPLRDKLSLPDVVRRFELNINDFKQASIQHISYIEEKNSGTALAILNQKLLITNTAATMQSTLTHYTNHAANVFDEPHNKRYLSQLPWLRQGTCILNNSVYAPGDSSSPSPLSAFSKVLPVMVGAIQAMPNQRLAIRFIAPVVLSGISDNNLRISIQNLFQTTDTFPQANQLPSDTGLMVGVNDMDKMYDLYHTYLMPADNERWLSMMSLILNGFRIDWRKDIISLLEKRTVIASRAGQQQSLMLLLDKTSQKDQNLDKLSALLSTNAFPIKQEMAPIGNLSVKTLSLPAPMAQGTQSRISYGTVGTSLVFATPDDFAQTVQVANHEQSSLAAQPTYQATMDGLPSHSNMLLYLHVPKHPPSIAPNSRNPHLQSTMALQWLDAVGLSLWATPQDKDGITLLNGQLNLQLAHRKS